MNKINMTPLSQLALRIIKEQELIIGPLAWIEARKVAGIHVINQNAGELSIDDNNQGPIIDRLVTQYERLFGRASVEVCREAAAPLLSELSSEQIPSSLK